MSGNIRAKPLDFDFRASNGKQYSGKRLQPPERNSSRTLVLRVDLSKHFDNKFWNEDVFTWHSNKLRSWNMVNLLCERGPFCLNCYKKVTKLKNSNVSQLNASKWTLISFWRPFIICLFTYLFIYLFIYSYIYLFIYLYILYVCKCMYLFIYLFIYLYS